MNLVFGYVADGTIGYDQGSCQLKAWVDDAA
jgi:hypothetical protein